MDATRHTCLKLELPDSNEAIFVKGTWLESRFELAITDGLDAWLCNASEEEVKERAGQWDQPVTEYIKLAERYLGFQQPGSVYSFSDAGDGYRRLSWTLEKEGTKLEWRWKCRPAPNMKNVTAGILDFLMDANIRLSDEVVHKTQSFEKMKVEAEKCLAQSERLRNEKEKFESAIYVKFLGVLNSKKSKLRELRDRLSKQESAAAKSSEEEEAEAESSDKTETFDEKNEDANSEDEPMKDSASTSKSGPASRPRGRKRITRK